MPPVPTMIITPFVAEGAVPSNVTYSAVAVMLVGEILKYFLDGFAGRRVVAVASALKLEETPVANVTREGEDGIGQ